ncbi:MAG: cytochrome oxidase biogenesis protein Surf1, facilitates heme A insertion [Pseudooceanicola sp.]|jgi:surfeit locus 1 family protein|nr:cytochrome oxidase biogenesis protein Surf1, facilitates heme A insertion [Pseudooceanicola sp.]
MKRFGFLFVFGLTGFAILIGLGVWQVQRLDWKRSVLAEIEARIAAPEVALPDAPDAETDKYLAVQVAGTILAGELHVLVSRKNIGAGFRIIAPFETDGGRRILLDRGFVPTAAADAERSLGPVTVAGNLHWPNETDSYTPEPDIAANTWFARDVPAMAAALGTEPVLLVARTDTGPSPMPVGTEGIPNDHLQYAITWFSLALIWAAMTAFFLWRPGAPKNG